MYNFSAIVLAAGNGTRFLSNTPKILHNIGNAPLFMHLIRKLSAIGCPDIIMVTDKSYGTFNYTASFQNVTEVYQEEKLGTGHAVQIAYPYLRKEYEYVFVLYGDTPLIKPETINNAIKTISSDKSIGVAILSIKKESPDGYGSLIITKDGNVEAILEQGVTNQYSGHISNYCNAGLLIRRNILDQYLMNLIPNHFKKEILITDLINLSFKAGNKNIIIERSLDELIGINTREALATAERLFQEEKRIACLKNGVTLIDPSTVYFSYDTDVGIDSIIYPNVFFGPRVKLGKNNTILPFSNLEDISTECNVKIGPFARLRGGCNLSEKSEIGNFVEIKKSNIGEKSKIKHLSYIGDTNLGSSCNVGAGTITCNYDGVNKFRTEISNNVFIGSNTTIISPIKIEANSIIGAGTTLTKDVLEHEIAIGRTEQKNIPDGAKKYFSKRIKNK